MGHFIRDGFVIIDNSREVKDFLRIIGTKYRFGIEKNMKELEFEVLATQNANLAQCWYLDSNPQT